MMLFKFESTITKTTLGIFTSVLSIKTIKSFKRSPRDEQVVQGAYLPLSLVPSQFCTSLQTGNPEIARKHQISISIQNLSLGWNWDLELCISRLLVWPKGNPETNCTEMPYTVGMREGGRSMRWEQAVLPLGPSRQPARSSEPADCVI